MPNPALKRDGAKARRPLAPRYPKPYDATAQQYAHQHNHFTLDTVSEDSRVYVCSGTTEPTHTGHLR